jgi:hypothetical protein
MRRTITPAIPPSMYRHFAIVTVVLTVGIAVFAEGESRQDQAAPAVQAAKPPAPPALVTANATNGSTPAASWSDFDSDSGFGAAMEGPPGGGDNGLIHELEEGTVPGYARGGLATLSEEERELLLGGLQ